MAASHLSADEFFTGLAALISTTQQKGHGAIYLSQKRLTFGSDVEPSNAKAADDLLWDTHPPHPLPLIVRATDGKTQSKDRVKNKDKTKLSTVVKSDEIEAFFARYADICKVEMQSLKKRDRSKRKKEKTRKKKSASDTKKA